MNNISQIRHLVKLKHMTPADYIYTKGIQACIHSSQLSVGWLLIGGVAVDRRRDHGWCMADGSAGGKETIVKLAS